MGSWQLLYVYNIRFVSVRVQFEFYDVSRLLLRELETFVRAEKKRLLGRRVGNLLGVRAHAQLLHTI